MPPRSANKIALFAPVVSDRIHCRAPSAVTTARGIVVAVELIHQCLYRLVESDCLLRRHFCFHAHKS